MQISIVIPAHNEEAYLAQTLLSLTEQSFLPKQIVVVNDGSSDGTQAIIDQFSENHPYISGVLIDSEGEHAPGSKIINAFYKGYDTLDLDYDIVCKFDADLIFPKEYLETIRNVFQKNKNCGMAGGFCDIQHGKDWKLEKLTNKDHIRGALKAYTKRCFKTIGGLKNAMGWDTVDELIAQFHGFSIITVDKLHVKHLKPTGNNYTKKSRYKQGEAFYCMRYGKALTQIASAKLAFNKGKFRFYFDCIRGYNRAKKEGLPFLVSEEEGIFIRKLRKDGIKKKLL
ncbi:MAG: glycosyltransferase involved in cell wall biosynthesis [Candidatus Latescibacterota bacterium]|jgi:glycosyltransferase involved in cell wall biosynthesis